MKKIILATILALTLASNANASCFCACVNGVNQPVCDWNHERFSIMCGPAVCLNGN